MKILYLGASFKHSTSAHRASALRRLGHEVLHVDARQALPKGRLTGGLSVRFGFGIFAPLVLRYLKARVEASSFDLAWIDGGAELGPLVYRWLKDAEVKIINYNVDDPFGRRDGKKWSLYQAAVPFHNLTVVVRNENMEEARACGARRVERVFRSYDPVAHAPVELTADESGEYASDISFIGTWMPERGPFMARLLELGVPLSIRGDWWHKAPEWPRLEPVWKGPGLYGRDFVAATLASKVALGLLSKGNRDLHTTRSAEVPYMGGPIFCAERTNEHSQMFEEGIEALFWETPEECAEQSLKLLKDERSRQNMAQAAKRKVEAAGYSNDAVMKYLLESL